MLQTWRLGQRTSSGAAELYVVHRSEGQVSDRIPLGYATLPCRFVQESHRGRRTIKAVPPEGSSSVVGSIAQLAVTTTICSDAARKTCNTQSMKTWDVRGIWRTVRRAAVHERPRIGVPGDVSSAALSNARLASRTAVSWLQNEATFWPSSSCVASVA